VRLDLFDEATREARDRLHCTASQPPPSFRAHVYARAIMRLVEDDRGDCEKFYDAYLRVRGHPTATLVALVLIHREQFGREHLSLMH
jgi:hypothetical protein